MKIKQYHLITTKSHVDLDRIVNEYLDDGWELYGGPIMSGGYAQAVVRLDTA